MLQHIAERKSNGFDWIDITDPSSEELEQITKTYELHEALVKDCLQPDHLPKFEKMENYNFIIFRVHTGKETLEADTVQDLTNKVAIFYGEHFIITIHRTEQAFLKNAIDQVNSTACDNTLKLINIIIFLCLATYEQPYNQLARTVDFYEETIFLRNKKGSLLKGLYHIKRKIDLIRRMFALSFEIVDTIDNTPGNESTRDTRDLYVRLQNVYDILSEDIHQLLAIYFSASSQKTNETMRVLTIFSVFFMPLTFIVGIYGMNFDFMPELRWKMGYPGVMVLMVLVTIIIYVWFRRKRWL